MEKEDTHLLSVAEVSERLGVGKSTAYKVIKELNAVMESRGFKTIRGRVSNQILEEMYFAKKGGRANGR